MSVLTPSIIHAPGEAIEVVSYDRQRKYYLRTPENRDYGPYRGAVAALGGQDWSRLEMTAALRAALAELLPAEEDAAERERLVATVTAYEDRLRAANKAYLDERTAEALRELNEAFTIPPALSRIWHGVLAVPTVTRFHEMVGHINSFPFRAGEAATMFLVGWEGIADRDGQPVAFRRGLGGVPPELVKAVPSVDLPLLADRVQSLLMPPEIRLGNSSSRPSGSSNPTSSGETRGRRPNGRSGTTKSHGTSDSSDLTTAGLPGSASIQ